jgi:hypothetical protein
MDRLLALRETARKPVKLVAHRCAGSYKNWWKRRTPSRKPRRAPRRKLSDALCFNFGSSGKAGDLFQPGISSCAHDDNWNRLTAYKTSGRLLPDKISGP